MKNRSNCNPQKGRNYILNTVYKMLQSLDSTECIFTKQNMSKKERNALKSLARDENIVILEADKVIIVD